MIRMAQGKRGMGFEELVNYANAQYKEKHIALVDKLPTPVKVLQSKGVQVLKGFFEAKSTVDYYGMYRGRPLVFEAKSTELETRYKLDTLREHQVEYLREASSYGAIAFVLVEFSKLHEVYYVPVKLILSAWDMSKDGGAKSIPYDVLSRSCYQVHQGRGIVLDYLAVVDVVIHQLADQTVESAHIT